MWIKLRERRRRRIAEELGSECKSEAAHIKQWKKTRAKARRL